MSAERNVQSQQKRKARVFILLGQSNMLGMGTVEGDQEGSLEYAVTTKGLYPYLVDPNNDDGADDDRTTSGPAFVSTAKWKKEIDPRVRNVFTMGSGTSPGRIIHNEWMTIQGCRTIGPEIGIGHELGNWLHPSSRAGVSGNEDDDDDGEKIMMLKSCIGNRSLGWDLLPPGSPSFEYTDQGTNKVWHYAGYKESPSRWEVGTNPDPMGWYAGMQYDGDVDRAKQILVNLSQYVPDTFAYEVVGFFFWQGDKDRYDQAYASHYKANLVRFIRRLRVDFQAPGAKFVCATLGQTPMEGAKGNDELIFKAQMEVAELPEFADNVACVYSKPFCHGGASNSHYNKNAETYMDVGQAMGRAMVSLLGGGCR
jgi:Carbohydrate esterase, sialic acid-specific acetylesterase